MIQVGGSHDLARMQRELARIARRDLNRELVTAAARATKDVRPAFAAAALAALPRRGGLNAWVASRLTARARARAMGSGVNARVTVTRAGADIRALNQGRARHPVYGHDVWVNQPVAAGWLDEVARGPLAVDARGEFVAAVERLKTQIPKH